MMYFVSPTKGVLSFEAMFEDIMRYTAEVPNTVYKLVVGTDSHSRDELCFVTAVIVHRVGKGGRYYYRKRRHRAMTSLRQRIFYEASLSLEVAARLAGRFAENGFTELNKLNVEIHLDIGQEGESKELIKEVVGMIVGSGFYPRIKPEAYGASKVADKHTK